MTLDLRASDGGTVLKLRVRPKAGRAGLGGIHAGAVRVNVQEAPERGLATRAAVALVARELGVPRGEIRLLTGAASHDKTVWVPLGLEAVLSRLGS
jgi:uncharacterized protein YggU (UPF0235/DUF167 family)